MLICISICGFEAVLFLLEFLHIPRLVEHTKKQQKPDGKEIVR